MFYDIIIAIIVVLLILYLFYAYMNWSSEQYIRYESAEIDTLRYVPPKWAIDAWHPTYYTIVYNTNKGKVYLRYYLM